MTDGPGFAVRSDVGLIRTGNEDRYLARPPLFAVADGMGGHQAGEVASQLAIELLSQTAERDPAPDTGAVVNAIKRSNIAIRREAKARSELDGMGTTCTVAVVGDDVRIAHVGDSRAYRFRGNRLEQLTEDHSLVATMVREGILGADEALTDGRRNIITRALGAEDDVRVDIVTADLAPGDRLLLCSDGLHGQVDDWTIASVLADEVAPGRAAERLVELANAAGGEDNVTLIVIDADVVAPRRVDGRVRAGHGASEADLPADAAATTIVAPPPVPGADGAGADPVEPGAEPERIAGAEPTAAAMPAPTATAMAISPRRPRPRAAVLVLLAALAVAALGWAFVNQFGQGSTPSAAPTPEAPPPSVVTQPASPAPGASSPAVPTPGPSVAPAP